MRKLLIVLILETVLSGCIALGACAGTDAIGDCRGIWVADGAAVELWREQGEPRCRAVFLDGDGESYSFCFSTSSEISR